MKICVQGLWHLGCVTAACLASVGHKVIGLDFDSRIIEDLKNKKLPIYEPGLDNLICAGLTEGLINFIDNPQDLPKDIEFLWITYDTPVNEDDEANIEFVYEQIKITLPYLPSETTVIVSSQLPVGSIKLLENMVQNICPEKTLHFACSPENLRLGKSLDVFLQPDRIVMGVRSEADKLNIERLLAPITNKIEWMSVESAEMTKHAINAFLATSVVFANEIASICEMVGADAKEVERGLKTEHRIGPKAYLSPGAAFAGGTLARDIEFLKKISNKHNFKSPLLHSVKTSNDEHKNWIRNKLSALFPNLKNVTVALWGLTYKPGTNTLRRSLSVELCDWLLEQGAILQVHDPVVTALPENWQNRVQQFSNAVDALNTAQVLIVGTEWPEYKELNAESVAKQLTSNLHVLDPNRFLKSWTKFSQIQYLAVGSPSL